ncbi:arsenate reductase family protein [Flavobacteriaceae bacterium M23B6Z8]
MSIIAKDKNTITLIYNSETSLGKQTYPYVKSMDKPTRFIDISKDNVTGTQWAEVAQMIGIEVKDLINTSHADFKKQFEADGAKLETHDWIKVLDKNPSLLRCPILIKGDEFFLIETPSEVTHLIDPDSPGIGIPHTDA